MTKAWHESDDPDVVASGVSKRLALWIVVAVAFFAVLAAVIWMVGVGTSDLHGSGEAIKQRYNANNRIAAQERFEERFADIKAADRRIDVAKATLDADPADPTLRTNYTGAVQYCISAVGEYNADARKYTAEAFRAKDLPAQIDDTDPATDCKETTK
jgi:hypothetical protein